jgi:hypothetical protein
LKVTPRKQVRTELGRGGIFETDKISQRSARARESNDERARFIGAQSAQRGGLVANSVDGRLCYRARTAGLRHRHQVQARIWFYRLWNPSESLNTANIDVNGVYFGSVEPGSAFYRDVAPGVYQIVPQNQYFDYNQNTNVAVVPGQQVFIAVLDLSSWANAVSGAQRSVHRDSWYARLVPPQYALAQIANPALVPRAGAVPAGAFIY